jgi:protein-tyrosine-phosphatase/DNA-binding transcriptional ArsR family regulator
MMRRSNAKDSFRSASFDSVDAAAIFAALGQRWRLEVFRLLIRYLPYGLSAGDIARLIAIPHNTLSTHLGILEQVGLLRSRREGRSIIFSAVQEQAHRLAGFLTENCCAESGGACEPSEGAIGRFPVRREIAAPGSVHNVLILCSGNSARSILAEAILNKEGAGRFRAFSAGTHPKQNPDPECLNLLKALGYDTEGVRSKSWREFTYPDSPKMEVVLTVCDAAASEISVHWPGDPVAAHWGIADPDSITGSESARRAAFIEAYRRLTARISGLVNLDIERLTPSVLARNLRAIGAMEGATAMAIDNGRRIAARDDG